MERNVSHLLFDLNEPPPNNFNIDLNQPAASFLDTNNIELASNSLPSKLRRKNLTPGQKKAIAEMLLQEQNGGKLPNGTKKKVVECFSISEKSVQRLWRSARPIAIDRVLPNLSLNLMKSTCRKRVEIKLSSIREIPLRKRTNIRSLSKALKLGKPTIHRRIKEGFIKPHSNTLKPLLNEENRKAKLEFCLSMIDQGSSENSHFFVDMNDRIHIDEKWFNITKSSQKFYLHLKEDEPYRTCKSKRFIVKIMFLAAVARPRTDENSGISFDGKIGLWPFVVKEPAKRNSKNRSAGTLETKPILSMTKDVVRSIMINKLLPAIKEKWLMFSSKTIFVQQDNAKPHLDVNDYEFVNAAESDGYDINLCCQPLNRPDMNVLDLGFFRAIDSLQHQEASTNIDEFIVAVQTAFEKIPTEELNNVFLTLQTCMVEVMKNNGGNNYKIPHLSKHRLIRIGQLPKRIEIDQEVVNQAKNAFQI